MWIDGHVLCWSLLPRFRYYVTDVQSQVQDQESSRFIQELPKPLCVYSQLDDEGTPPKKRYFWQFNVTDTTARFVSAPY